MSDCRHSDSVNAALRLEIVPPQFSADAPPTRPVLKLKPKTGPIVAASVARKEAKP